MRKTMLVFLALAIPLLIWANAVPNHLKKQPLFAPDIVKVQLTSAALSQTNLPEGLYAEASQFGIPELDRIMGQYGGNKVIRAHIRLKDTAWEMKHGVNRWFLVRFSHVIDVPSVLQSFKSSKFIEVAVPEYYAYPQSVPNDTYYANNWGHNNTAQLPLYSEGSHSGAGVGTVGFDSNAQSAWDYTQGYGSTSVKIAIIDSGVDTSHPDLRLITGFDFGDNDSNPDDDSADQGHGTACAGIAAAIANNSLGVAGIAGGCSIMPIKIASTTGGLLFTEIANALYYAADNDADIASMSFGVGILVGDYPPGDDALAYAYGLGVVLIAAAGDDDIDMIYYPANYPNVIAVGASSPTGERKTYTSSDGEDWWGSNYGLNIINNDDAIDLMAPTILPTTDIVGENGYDTSNYYMWFSGTSCATAYVTGVAALILSYSPSLNPAQVFNALTSTATDMTIDGGTGWDMYTGYGLVNAEGALASLNPGLPVCEITTPLNSVYYNLGDDVYVNVAASDTSPGSISRVDFYLDGAVTSSHTEYYYPYEWTWDTTGASSGNHTITATAVDNENNSSSDVVTFTLLNPATEGFESGNLREFPWVSSGNVYWRARSSVAFTGNYAAKSGNISDNQTSSMTMNLVITTAGNISFFCKTSSELGYDFLTFYIDNVAQGSWSGEMPWSEQSYPVTTGSHAFRWTYAKDISASDGDDCAYVDHIIIPPYEESTPPNITWSPSSIALTLLSDTTTTRNLVIGNSGDQTLNYTATKLVMDESFEDGSGIPSGWTQQYVTGSTDWVLATGGFNEHPASAFDGTYNARLFSYTHTVTKLVSPVFNLSGTSSPVLTFYHTQENWEGDQDTLKVYYKTSSNGSWVLLQAFTSNVPSWTQRTITLLNPSSTYYIAFEGNASYGYGLCLDKITVSKQEGMIAPWLTLNSGASVNGSIAGGEANETITVGFNTTGMTGGVYTASITVTCNSRTNSLVTIPITLTVDSPAPTITVNRTSMSFGTVRVNTTASQTFTISNAGSAVLLGTITTPPGYSVSLSRSVAGNNPEATSLANRNSGLNPLMGKPAALPQSANASNQRNTLSYSVAIGTTNTYSIVFEPIATQSYPGNVTITHNAGGASKSIALSGVGGKPSLDVSAYSFTANIAPGGTNIQNVSISNSGNMSLTYGLTISGSPAWLRINGGTTVSNTIAVSGSAQNVNITCNATGMTPGTYTATINGTSNDPDEPTFSIGVTLTVRIPVVISAPDGTSQWPVGSFHNITWNYTGTGTSVTLYYSTNGGTDWTSLGSRTSAQGVNNYSWTIPDSPSTNCKVKITDSIAPNYAAIGDTFIIYDPAAPTTPQNVSITASQATGNITISWDASGGYFTGYKIYKCPNPSFAPEDTVLVGTKTYSETSITIPAASVSPYAFYRVIAYRD